MSNTGNVNEMHTQVLLGHGMRVVIQGERWLDVYIYASPNDWQHTQGRYCIYINYSHVGYMNINVQP